MSCERALNFDSPATGIAAALPLAEARLSVVIGQSRCYTFNVEIAPVSKLRESSSSSDLSAGVTRDKKAGHSHHFSSIN